MRRLLLGVLVGFLIIGSTSLASTDKLYDIAAILSGTFEGSTPGNHLRLDLRPISIDPEHPYDLFLSVTGQFCDA